MRALILTVSVLVLLGGMPGCVPPVQALREGTVSTGREKADTANATLVILGSAEEEYVRGMARAFELETGIRTTYVRKSTGEALDVIRANAQAPQFSVWWGGSVDSYIAASAEGLLAPYKPKGSSIVPNQYKDPNGNWSGIYVGALALAVNPRVLAEKGLPPPTSWADLTNPIYRGQITVAHPATSGTAYTMAATIMQLHSKNLDEGFEYLQALSRNVVEYQRAGSAPAFLAGRGEVAIGIAFSHDIVGAKEAGYEPLNVVFPSEGTGYEIGGMALLKNAPEPALGQRFMDWAMTERAQELGPLFTAYQIPTNPNAKVPQKSVRLSSVKTIDYDFQWSGANRDAVVTRFSREIAPPPETQRPVR